MRSSTRAADRAALIAVWDASTAKPASARNASRQWVMRTGNLARFAAWACTVLPSTAVLDAMGWSPEELDRICSTRFDESTARPSNPAGWQRRQGRATEQQRRWNNEGWARDGSSDDR